MHAWKKHSWFAALLFGLTACSSTSEVADASLPDEAELEARVRAALVGAPDPDGI